MANIEILQGDITSLDIDAVVCPAHKHLIKGRGLSAQVFDIAGDALAEACAEQSHCEVGEARITPAFDLPCRFIIHTVTPLWTGGDQWGESELANLRACFRSAAALAMEYNLESLAFPALGAGTNKFPQALVASIGLEVLNESASAFKRLVVMLRSDEALEVWRETQHKIALHI